MHRTIAAAAMLLAQGAPAISGQQGAPALPALNVELNKLEQVDGSCRSYMVVTNSAAADLQTLTLDLVAFDRDGVIDRRLAADLGPVAAGRTRVRVFDMTGLDCGQVVRVLVNDVLTCAPGDFADAGCDAALAVSGRGAVELIR